MYLITATGPAFNPCGQISIAFMLLFQKKLNLRWLGPPGSQCPGCSGACREASLLGTSTNGNPT